MTWKKIAKWREAEVMLQVEEKLVSIMSVEFEFYTSRNKIEMPAAESRIWLENSEIERKRKKNDTYLLEVFKLY